MKKFNEEIYQDWLQENNKRRCADTVIEFMKLQDVQEGEEKEEEEFMTLREELADVLDMPIEGFVVQLQRETEYEDDGFCISLQTMVRNVDKVVRTQMALELVNTCLPEPFKIPKTAVNSEEKVMLFNFLVQKIAREL